jgi:hypothetical protein
MLKSDTSSLIRVTNKWSVLNSDFLIREIYMEVNELKANDFRGKFQGLNKIVMEVINQKLSTGKDHS